MCAFSQKLRANLNVLPISIYWRECDHILSLIILSYVMLSEGGSAECDTMIIYRSLSLLVPKPEPTLPPLTFCTNMHSVNNIYKFYVILVDQNNTGPCWSASQNTATLVAKREWIFKILQTGFVLSRKMLNLRCWNMHSSISFRRESLLSKNNK